MPSFRCVRFCLLVPVTIAPFSQVGSAVRRPCEPRAQPLCCHLAQQVCSQNLTGFGTSNNLLPSRRSVQRSAAPVNRPHLHSPVPPHLLCHLS